MSRHRIAGPFIALLGLLALAAVPAQAETPPDTLVMAKDIADIITFDPAEAFEIMTGELIANVYDRIMTFEPENPRTLTGGVAESHAVSDDGRTITFRLRDGLTFHSGNPVRPEDVEFSLERAVFLDRSPAFIVTQFGWNADNVGELIEVVDDRHVRITIAEGFSPGLVLNALSAGVASVVDRKLVLAHERDSDLGTAWLQTNSAGSDESVALEANPDYRHGAPGVQRVILRHAVDYHGMVESFLAGQFIVHQAFWPRGLWAAYTGAPYRLDLPRARSLLAQGGHGDGFAVRLDTLGSPPFPAIAESIRATLGKIGIEAQVVTQEGATLWPQYRAGARADPRPLVARLRRSARQRRRVRSQSGQPPGGQAHRRARVAQRVGSGRPERGGDPRA